MGGNNNYHCDYDAMDIKLFAELRAYLPFPESKTWTCRVNTICRHNSLVLFHHCRNNRLVPTVYYNTHKRNDRVCLMA